MKPILCVGDVALDVVVKFDGAINFDSDTKSKITTHGGGAAANTSAWLAALGSRVHLIGKVGDDSIGAELVSQLTQIGVDFSAPPAKGESSGVVVVLVDNQGARTMFPDSGANSKLTHLDLPEKIDFDFAFLSGYALFNPASHVEVLKIVEKLRGNDVKIIFDPASVGTMKSFGIERARDLLSLFDICILNESEANFLSGGNEAKGSYRKLSGEIPVVVIKRGANGAIAGEQSSEVIERAALDVQVIDTTGAGDAFNAGFIKHWVETHSLTASLDLAIETSAQCVGIIGARPSVNP